jgi:hypothetical protein
MARLFEVVGSDQHLVASGDSQSYLEDLSRVQQSDKDKAALAAVITGYLPILVRRIDSLSKQLIAIGSSYAAAVSSQSEIEADLATVVGKGMVNNLQSTTLAYANSDPQGKINQATSAGVTQTVMTASMNSAQEVFRLALRDASVLSDRELGLNDFYTRYAAHLQKVQNRISAELSSLSYIRESLVTMLGFITNV